MERKPDASTWVRSSSAPAESGCSISATFSWRQLDWFEEDEQALVHARDPHKRVDTLRSSRQVEVRVEGDESIRTLTNKNTDGPTIKKTAVARGMRTLRDEGVAKVLAGVTTIEEVLRVTMRATQ